MGKKIGLNLRRADRPKEASSAVPPRTELERRLEDKATPAKEQDFIKAALTMAEDLRSQRTRDNHGLPRQLREGADAAVETAALKMLEKGLPAEKSAAQCFVDLALPFTGPVKSRAHATARGALGRAGGAYAAPKEAFTRAISWATWHSFNDPVDKQTLSKIKDRAGRESRYREGFMSDSGPVISWKALGDRAKANDRMLRDGLAWFAELDEPKRLLLPETPESKIGKRLPKVGFGEVHEALLGWLEEARGNANHGGAWHIAEKHVEHAVTALESPGFQEWLKAAPDERLAPLIEKLEPLEGRKYTPGSFQDSPDNRRAYGGAMEAVEKLRALITQVQAPAAK